ncbi:MAG TPA: LLM class flavin-dependent oxidoreductase [Deltaproteobacteria bacterium]|nr:LLM class flavin-dependent oxidoreductase [Deltaproteobacteria bacterium]
MKRSLLYQIGAGGESEFSDMLAEVELAERLGFDTVWCFPEAGEEGGFLEGAPAIWLSALSERTDRIRLGWGVAAMMPPAIPPIRLAEQAASIDLASRGRLEMAFLPGALLDDGDAGSWDEGVRMLVDMWDGPAFSWTSARFRVMPVEIVPKPIQKPHPPLWLTGWSLDHARKAGEAGLAFLDVSGASDDVLEAHRQAYLDARRLADPDALVAMGLRAIAIDLSPDAPNEERIEAWGAAGVDQLILRAGPLEGGHAEACRRIRCLAGA